MAAERKHVVVKPLENTPTFDSFEIDINLTSDHIISDIRDVVSAKLGVPKKYLRIQVGEGMNAITSNHPGQEGYLLPALRATSEIYVNQQPKNIQEKDMLVLTFRCKEKLFVKEFNQHSPTIIQDIKGKISAELADTPAGKLEVWLAGAAFDSNADLDEFWNIILFDGLAINIVGPWMKKQTHIQNQTFLPLPTDKDILQKKCEVLAEEINKLLKSHDLVMPTGQAVYDTVGKVLLCIRGGIPNQFKNYLLSNKIFTIINKPNIINIMKDIEKMVVDEPSKKLCKEIEDRMTIKAADAISQAKRNGI